MSRRIRIGSVPYLNAKPLVHGLEQGLAAHRVELSTAVPSVLAARLAEGSLDLATLPVIELARIPGLEIVPGMGISARGKAASVLLVTRKALPAVRSVALDPESRSSNALAHVLFAHFWKGTPRFAPGPLSLDDALAGSDAAVRIGDKALFDPLPAGTEAVDLGEAWWNWTGLPFVFAVWAARPGVMEPGISRILHDSLREGARSLERIAAGYRWNARTDPERSLDYLTRRMFYGLGGRELEAVERFLAAAHTIGLVERREKLRLASFDPAVPATTEP